MADLLPNPEPRARALPRQALSPHRFKRSFAYALRGVQAVWRREPNFRIEVGLAALALALCAWLGVSALPVVLVSALVLALELVNSALEAAIDLLSPELHPLAEHAKDAAAGAVLIASAAALLVGLWHLGPPLLERLLP